MMPKNLWSNSFNLKRQMQTLQRSLRSWGFRLVVSFLPLYQSGSGCLRLSRFAAIRVVPGGGVKPLCWNVHNTVLSLRENLPETVQPFTYIKILQSLWCIQRHPKNLDIIHTSGEITPNPNNGDVIIDILHFHNFSGLKPDGKLFLLLRELWPHLPPNLSGQNSPACAPPPSFYSHGRFEDTKALRESLPSPGGEDHSWGGAKWPFSSLESLWLVVFQFQGPLKPSLCSVACLCALYVPSCLVYLYLYRINFSSICGCVQVWDIIGRWCTDLSG